MAEGRLAARLLASESEIESQLCELQAYRRELDALYSQKQAELLQSRASLTHAQEQSERLAVENESLRKWNGELTEQLVVYKRELHRLVLGLESETGTHLGCEPACGGDSSVELKRSGDELGGAMAEQKRELDSLHAGLRLVRTQVELEKTRSELRAAGEGVSQLQQSALALSTDFNAATRQIGKLEERLEEQVRKLEHANAEKAQLQVRLSEADSNQQELWSSLQNAQSLCQTLEAERTELLEGPVAEAERRCRECGERERQLRVVLERHAREGALSAAALRTLKEDAHARMEENVQLRLLCQRLGASPLELQRARRSEDVPIAPAKRPPAVGYLESRQSERISTSELISTECDASPAPAVMEPSNAYASLQVCE